VIHFFDSFGHASAGSHTPDAVGDDLRVNWSSPSSFTITELASATEGRRCYLTGTPGNEIVPLFGPPSAPSILLGFRVWIDDLTTSRLLCRVINPNGAHVGGIGVDATDDTLVYTIASGLNPESSVAKSSVSLSVGWNYVEVKILVDNSAGEVHFQIGGNPAGSTTGIDTFQGGGGAEVGSVTVAFLPDEGTGVWDADDRLADVYIADYADDFYGQTEVWYQPADTAGSSADFTPSAGSNHQNVDDIGNDGDATYNSSATPGDRDSFAHSGVQTASARAVQIIAAVRSEAGPLGKVALGVLSAGSEAEDSIGQVVEAYDVVRGSIVADDPDTSSPWDAAGVNAAQTYIEIQA